MANKESEEKKKRVLHKTQSEQAVDKREALGALPFGLEELEAQSVLTWRE